MSSNKGKLLLKEPLLVLEKYSDNPDGLRDTGYWDLMVGFELNGRMDTYKAALKKHGLTHPVVPIPKGIKIPLRITRRILKNT